MATFNDCTEERDRERKSDRQSFPPQPRMAERAGEQTKAHFPLIKSSENIPFVSASAAEARPGPARRQPTVSVDYVAAAIYIAH